MIKSLAKKLLESKLKQSYPFHTTYVFTDDYEAIAALEKWLKRLCKKSEKLSIERINTGLHITYRGAFTHTLRITDRDHISKTMQEEGVKVTVDKDYHWYDKEKHKGVTII